MNIEVQPTKTRGLAWIQTREGFAFHPERPDPETISIETIARCLACTPRFCGHTIFPYSVAAHSIHVSRIVSRMLIEAGQDGPGSYDLSPIERWALPLAGLLHDAHEAYSGFGDVGSPVKGLCPLISDIERRIDIAVAVKFELPSDIFKHPIVKHADLVALATESRDLMAEHPLPWKQLPQPETLKIQPKQVHGSVIERRFTERFDELMFGRVKPETSGGV